MSICFSATSRLHKREPRNDTSRDLRKKGETKISLPRSALSRGIYPPGAWSWTLNEISTTLGGSRCETILAPHKELGYRPTRGTE